MPSGLSCACCLPSCADMPKWKSKYDCERKYQEKWEKDFSWLTASPDEKDKAYCKICHRSLQAKRDAFVPHEKTDVHKSKVAAISRVRTCFVPKVQPPKRSVQEAELMLAVQTACHGAIRTIDHLGVSE